DSDFVSAESFRKKYSKYNANHANVLEYLIKADQEGKYEKAKAILKKALEVAEGFDKTEVLAALGKWQFKKQDWEKSLKYFSQIEFESEKPSSLTIRQIAIILTAISSKGATFHSILMQKIYFHSPLRNSFAL